MYQQRRPLQGLAGAVFMVFLILAIASHGFFLPVILVGLGLSALLGSAGSSSNWRGAYGGFLGFVFFLGLAACSFFDWWWPGILVTLAVVAILSSLSGMIGRNMTGRFMNNMPPQPTYQPPQQPYGGSPERYQPPVAPYNSSSESYQPQPYTGYQEGYQPSQPVLGTNPYTDNGKVYDAPHAGSPYDQPQSEYPPQEMPPQ